MSSPLTELFKHKSFLKLTRTHPIQLNQESHIFGQTKVTLIDTGVLMCEPMTESTEDSRCAVNLIISSGIHGNETAPIEIIERLVREVLEGNLVVCNRVLFIIGNPPAMLKGTRFNEENLNRLFCGNYIGKSHPEAQRAKLLESYVNDFFIGYSNLGYINKIERCHFDLHTAIRASKYEKFAIYPYQDGKAYQKRYLAFFEQSEIKTILLANQPAGTFTYFTSHQFNSNSFTVELGKVKPFGQNEMSSFSSIIENLKLIISAKYQFEERDTNQLNVFQVVDEIMRPESTIFELNVVDDVENFSTFPLGFQLTNDDNGGYVLESDEYAIVFPNKEVPVGNRVALIVNKTDI